MPYKSEKIRIDNTMYDRRRKLTQEQKEEIRAIYLTGVCGQRPLARQFGVSRSTIQIIVNDEIAKRKKQYVKDNWKKYVADKEEHARVMKEHRHYKQKLYLENKIKGVK